jgi:hypothetical protein
MLLDVAERGQVRTFRPPPLQRVVYRITLRPNDIEVLVDSGLHDIMTADELAKAIFIIIWLKEIAVAE